MTCKLMSSARSVPAENSSSDLTFSCCSAQIPLVALGGMGRSSCSEGDSNAAPSHRSLLLLGDARTPSRKRKPCPKKLCHLLQSVEAFIEHYYNRCRLHSAWGMNSAELERVIAGHDAVLSGFGPRVPISKGDANLLRNFAVALTSAMQHASVGRVVIESTAF